MELIDIRQACKKAVANHTCGAASPEVSVWYMDTIGFYEMCLDIAESVTGVREMSWPEFERYQIELSRYINRTGMFDRCN